MTQKKQFFYLKKRLDAIKGWDDVFEAKESGAVLSGKVVAIVKGGIIADCKGAGVFIPASLTGMGKNDDINTLSQKVVDFKIIDVEKGKRRRAVGSIKSVLSDARKAVAAKVWETIEQGMQFTGTVKSITNYGVFVDIGGVDGMVHITELSWSRIKHPSEVVSVGDVLSVYINSVDKETKRISLGYKLCKRQPIYSIRKQIQGGRYSGR